ncbi:MAG: hypothetical protein KBD01_16445 [Acidobacteria bacterium]|nr:hypothetical protein [Acidobacteriota bacterium]
MSDDRVGIDMLRDAIDRVAADLRARPAERRRRWPLALAAVLLLAAVLGFSLLPRRQPAVTVVVMKIQGRDVAARVVDARAAGSILVVPAQTRGGAPLGVAVGGHP